MYDILKDFQALIAALVALCAAAIAYTSAQRVASTQARTARETTERQVAHSLAREDEKEVKQRIAFMIMLGSRFRALATSLANRVNSLLLFRELGQTDEHGIYIAVNESPYWKAVSAFTLLREESWFYTLKWEDVSTLSGEDQTILNTVVTLINAADDAIIEVRDSAQQHDVLMKHTVAQAIQAFDAAIGFVPIAQEKISDSIMSSMEERGQIRERLR